MKLRIRGDSIRLRLTQAEVTQLSETGRVEESTRFGPDERFTYALALGGIALAAKLSSGGGIEISVPREVGHAWATGESVGMEGAQDLGDGSKLRILVEKDFACLTERPHEDDADAFPNPNGSC